MIGGMQGSPGETPEQRRMRLALQQQGQFQSQQAVQSPAPAAPVTATRQAPVTPVPVQRQAPVAGAPVAAPPDPLQATAAQVAPINVDTAAQDATRAQQQESIRLLQQAATGAAPSVAENQLVAAMNRAAQQRLGVAAQARGADQLALMREAQIGIGQDALDAGAAAGMARAAEMTGARTALADATTGARGQDIDLATKTAGLKAQVDTVNAQLATAVAQGNRDAVVQLEGLKKQLETQLTIATADQALKSRGLDLQRELTIRGLDQQWAAAIQANDTSRMNAIIQGLTSGAGLALGASDERLKTNVSRVPDNELQNFATKVADAIFGYQRKDTGQHEVGTMAQTVAGAGPLGKDVTGMVAPGIMGVDYGRLATLMAAAALRSGKEQM